MEDQRKEISLTAHSTISSITNVTDSSNITLSDADDGIPGGNSLLMFLEGRQQPTIGSRYITGAIRMQDYMYNLWLQQCLCDVVITCADQKMVYAHKIAIGSYSSTMSECFLKQTPFSTFHMHLSDYDVKIVVAILNFFYTTEVELNESIVECILDCSLELGVEEMVTICKDFLCQCDIETALFFLSIASKHELGDVEACIFDYICENYYIISKTQHFLDAQPKVIKKLLDENKLNVKNELEVFQSVVKWLNHKLKERIVFAPNLLSCVRMQLLSLKELIDEAEVERTFALPPCQKQLYEALKFHALRLSGILPPDFPIQKPRDTKEFSKAKFTTKLTLNVSKKGVSNVLRDPSLSTNMVYGQSEITIPLPNKRDLQNFQLNHVATIDCGCAHGLTKLNAKEAHLATEESLKAIVAVGGIDLHSAPSEILGRNIYKLSHGDSQWFPMGDLPQFTHHHGAVAVGCTIYVIGGIVYRACNCEVNSGATNACFAFNSQTSAWNALRPMQVPRAYLAVASYDGQIFAVGGEDNCNKKLDSVECYDIAADSWSILTHMPCGGKIGMSVAICWHYMYIVGGYSTNRTVLVDVECFDLQAQRWIPRRPLALPRCHANLVTANNRLYLVGGRTGFSDSSESVKSLSDVDVYDEFSDSWQKVAELGMARHDAGCAVVGSKIYIVGGMTTPTPQCLSSVECFDVDAGFWDQSSIDLPYYSTGLACCACIDERISRR